MLKMKIPWMLFGFGLMFGAAQGLKCRNCSDQLFKGEPYQHLPCFDKPSDDANTSSTCGSSEYCLTNITLDDGLPVVISRGCKDPMKDHDDTTSGMPTYNECQTTFDNSSYVTEHANCYYACKDPDNCTDLATTKSLLVCPSNCSHYLQQGYCDYLTGMCVCNEGYLGADCSKIDAGRSCLQCNSETDDNCLDPQPSQGKPCGIKKSRCSIYQTQTFNKNGNITRTAIVRGCTGDSPTLTKCAISDTSDNRVLRGYTEYTCSRVCDSDNCNIGSPNLHNRSNALFCLQCTSCGDSLSDGIRNETLCPLGSTHCFSKVHYLFSGGNIDIIQAEPVYKLLRHERGCATKAVENPGCETRPIPNSALTNVTCQESCARDGCNAGWPGRKQCAQCQANTSDSESQCYIKPAVKVNPCSHPYHDRCFTKEKSVGNQLKSKSDVNNHRGDILRGCDYKPSNGCWETKDNVFARYCHCDCYGERCNLDLTCHASKTLGSFVTIFIASWIGCFVRT